MGCRAEGCLDDAEGRRLRRIDADLEDLRDLSERTEKATPPPDTSRVGEWEQYWTKVLADARGERLTALADALALRLGMTVQVLRSEGRPWRRSTALGTVGI